MDTRQMWDIIVEQRLKLAAILRTLEPSQWAAPSLCGGWTVQDVAAHIISAPQLRGRAILGVFPLMLRYGYNGATLRDGQRRGRAGVPSILDQYERYAAVPRGPAVVGVRETLTDTLVHPQDLLRPLGIDFAMPTDAACVVAERLGRTGLLLGSRVVNSSVRMRATDADFAAGAGELVEGPIAELVMLRAGRAPRWERLDGPGVPVARRLFEQRSLNAPGFDSEPS